MLQFKIKNMKLVLSVCVMSMLLSPAFVKAESSSTGSIAARQAADQRAALAKKAEAQKKVTEEKAKAEQIQQTQTPAGEIPKEKTAE